MDETSQVSTLKVSRVETGKIYLVSDLHLGDGSHSDIFQHKDEHFLRFLDEVAREAETLIIVGDALDFDQAWYFSRIVKAHREVLSRLTRLSDQVRVVYVYGNHDPDIVLFRDILKWELCDKVVLDDEILIVHGYEFDTYVGGNFEGTTWGSRAFFAYESLFKTWIRFPLRDYYTLSNRMLHFIFYWAVLTTRLLRRIGPRLGRPQLGSRLQRTTRFWTRAVLGDPMDLTRVVLGELGPDSPWRSIVCGHSHVPGLVKTAADRSYLNLGSWSFGNSQYAVYDGESFLLKDWISGREFEDENYRPIIDGRTDLTFEEWFEDEYMGYLRFRSGEEALRSGVRPRPWANKPAPLPTRSPRGQSQTQRIQLIPRGGDPLDE